MIYQVKWNRDHWNEFLRSVRLKNQSFGANHDRFFNEKSRITLILEKFNIRVLNSENWSLCPLIILSLILSFVSNKTSRNYLVVFLQSWFQNGKKWNRIWRDLFQITFLNLFTRQIYCQWPAKYLLWQN